MLKAGFCELDITPPLGKMMPGQFYTRHGSGILDPLYTKALVLENGGARTAVVAADCLGMYDSSVDDFRQKLAARTGIEHMLFAATHTHTGGPVQSWGDHLTVDPAYVELLVDKSVDAAVMALERLQPVTLRIGHELEDGISFHRRFLMKDGSMRTNPGAKNPDIVKPAGPIDPAVTVMRLDDRDGNPLGFVTNFACHLDTVGGDKISADYPGELSRVLKNVYGQNIISLFLTGPCGDINHIDVVDSRERQPAYYRKMGRILAGKVVAAAEKAPVADTDTLAAARKAITCACRQPSAQDAEAGRRLIAVEKRTHETLYAARDGSLENLFYAKEAVRMFENPEPTAQLDITAMRIGELALVSAPAELFVEFSLAIKKASAFPHTMVSSLTNGMVGYVATREALAGGGYEARLASSAKMSADTGYQLADTAAELLRELHEGYGSAD